jgi:hypothetical protein
VRDQHHLGIRIRVARQVLVGEGQQAAGEVLQRFASGRPVVGDVRTPGVDLMPGELRPGPAFPLAEVDLGDRSSWRTCGQTSPASAPASSAQRCSGLLKTAAGGGCAPDSQRSRSLRTLSSRWARWGATSSRP